MRGQRACVAVVVAGLFASAGVTSCGGATPTEAGRASPGDAGWPGQGDTGTLFPPFVHVTQTGPLPRVDVGLAENTHGDLGGDTGDDTPVEPPDDDAPGPVVGLDLDVFAPFATQVFVAGTFNDWTPERHPLAASSDGRWRGSVAEARAGDRYKIVLDTAAGRLWKNDPRARAVTNSVGDSVVVAPQPSAQAGAANATQPFVPQPWNSAVIYEMHVGTFVDEPGGGPGTFDSAITRLDELAALGVTHVQLMPVSEFAGDFSWGYNPAHPFAVESSYGGLEGLRRFVDASHARGIAVIVDVVYNHLGPSDLDMWRFDGWHENDGGGVYFYNDDRAQTPWGHTRPDYGRPQVRDYLRDNALYWLTDLGLDGLRFDSTGNIRARLNGGMGDIPDGWSFLRDVNAAVDGLPSWKAMIAEDLGGIGAITSRLDEGGAGFDAQWDPGFVHPVRHALVEASDDARSMQDLRDALAERVDADPFGRVIYTESHDEVANGRSRVPEEIWPGNAGSWFSRRRALLGLVLTLTAPGVPMMFQGQEFLEDGWFTDTDPLDWSKRTAHDDVWQATRTLIGLRRNIDGNTRGLTGPHVNVFRVDEGAKVLAWHRWAEGGPGDDVVVVARFRDGGPAWVKLGFPHCGSWSVRAVVGDPELTAVEPEATVVAGPEGSDGLACSAWVDVGPYAAVVLSRD